LHGDEAENGHAVRISREEIAASVILPHFHAVQDVFSFHKPELGIRLDRLTRVTFIVDPDIHDKPRHFAATRDDGRLMMFAPEIVDLDVETLVAIVTHEFGHAADFVYPARWIMPPDGPGKARWIRDDEIATKPFRQWRKLWEDRNRDQVEWAADGVAEAVTGKKIGYCGDCIIQCFEGGIGRPKGLR